MRRVVRDGIKSVSQPAPPVTSDAVISNSDTDKNQLILDDGSSGARAALTTQRSRQRARTALGVYRTTPTSRVYRDRPRAVVARPSSRASRLVLTHAQASIRSASRDVTPTRARDVVDMAPARATRMETRARSLGNERMCELRGRRRRARGETFARRRARATTAAGASVASTSMEDDDDAYDERSQRQRLRRRATLAAVTDENEIELLLQATPQRVREALMEDERRLELTEIVLDLGRRPLARFPDGEEILSQELISYEDLEHMMARVGDIGHDNRAGINGTLHRISAIKNRYGKVIGATCRVGRAITGSAELIRDVLDASMTFQHSILLLGRPGVGKTTAIREISRILADEGGKRVVIVDTSNEIAGDGDVPHDGIGAARRMQVPKTIEQHLVLIEAVENHTPQTIVVDEIGTEAEAAAARTISERGVQMIATAHGHTLENVLKNPSLCDLIGGVVSVTLGDDEARRRGIQKSVLERARPSTFTCCVEMLDIDTWRVHTDVAGSVDALLAGQSPITELRTLNADGSVTKVAEYASRRGASLDGSASSSFLAYDPNALRQESTRRSVTVPFQQSSSALAALEVANSSSARRSINSASASFESTASRESINVDDCSLNALRVFPFKISRDALERVMDELGLTDKVCLVDLLEDASVVIAPKNQVKSSNWLRSAARARGMPIYAVRTDNSIQLVRALQAMLGITGASDGISGGKAAASRAIEGKETADAADAIDEARMAIEQLVIPHREPVELLPRAGVIIEMQQALVDTYMLNHTVMGQGAERRLRIECDYITAADISARRSEEEIETVQ